jgi:nucleotide-binding universal stress UspA family protein
MFVQNTPYLMVVLFYIDYSGRKIMFKKILIPTDGSALATQAALEGIDYAKRVGAEVICIYVAGENQATAFAFSPHAKQEVHWPTDSEYKQIVAETSKAIMAPVLQAASDAGVKFSEETDISKSPSASILAAAEKNGCDLIFMASRGNTGWEKMLLGSIAAKVIASSPIPVLVYKVQKDQLPKYTDYFPEV